MSYSSQHYFAAAGANPGTGWTIYEGYFKGAAASDNGNTHPRIDDPGTVDDGVFYISPHFLVNYNSTAGIYELDWIEVEQLTVPPIANNSAWSSSVTYPVGSVVRHRGRSWQCIRRATPSSQPPATGYWVEIGVHHAYNYRGTYSTSENYYWSDSVCDIVAYNDGGGIDFYRRSNYTGTGGSTPGAWVGSHWEIYGSQFEMVATNTLLAENAFLADWVISGGRIQSADGITTLYGSEGRIVLTGASVGGDTQYSRITPEGFISTTNVGVPAHAGQTGIDGDGNEITLPTLGAYAAVVGKNSATGTSLIPRAGVYGYTSNTTSAYAWGGLFNRLKAEDEFLSESLATLSGGLAVGVRYVTATSTLLPDDTYVRCGNSSTITVNLTSSANRKVGLVHIIHRTNASVTVSGNGANLMKAGSQATDTLGVDGRGGIYIWDGTYWSCLYIGL